MKRVTFFAQLALMSFTVFAQPLKVATFNVSMEATNYPQHGTMPRHKVLQHVLSTGDNPQVRNIAEIIQRVNPDIILLNEFDYIKHKEHGVDAFISRYLNVPQQGQTPLDYPYTYIATVNTGEPTVFDLDNDGEATRYGGDAFGYGLYPGQYGMALLSKYPINREAVRTFQYFKWKDMPNAQRPMRVDEHRQNTDESWYSEEEWNDFRLSSKSHWDIPVLVGNQTVHILAMHPTPPNFDGDEDRNGKRNSDEIRLMADYISLQNGDYIYDDSGEHISLSADSLFVLAGDFNAADIGEKYRQGVIEQLTEHPLVNNSTIPVSRGGASSSSLPYSDRFTAYWGARADYVLPSKRGMTVTDAGVFWPEKQSALYRLVDNRAASSDHRLVWVSLQLDK